MTVIHVHVGMIFLERCTNSLNTVPSRIVKAGPNSKGIMISLHTMYLCRPHATVVVSVVVTAPVSVSLPTLVRTARGVLVQVSALKTARSTWSVPSVLAMSLETWPCYLKRNSSTKTYCQGRAFQWDPRSTSPETPTNLSCPRPICGVTE